MQSTSSRLDRSDNSGNWACRPPQNIEGALVDLADRPIMCAATNDPSDPSGEIVYGCSDHALYAVSTDGFSNSHDGKCESESLLKPVKLHNKRYGHHDWVTGVAYTLRGNVVSGGMDGRLCYWSRDKQRCHTMTHHSRSISGVYNVGNSDIIVSSGYDCSVAVWDFGNTREPLHERGAITRSGDNEQVPVLNLRGHKSPVIEVAVTTSTIASGGKDGGLLIWDIPSGQQLARVRGHDNAPCSCLRMTDDSCMLLSAGGDGKIKLWDPRLKRLLCSQFSSPMGSLSSTRQQQQAITCLSLLKSSSNHFTTASSNGMVSVYDIRYNGSSSESAENGGRKSTATFSLISTFNEAIGGVHCLAPLSSSCIAAGDGAGMLIVYDVLRNHICYGLSSSSGGPIKTITTTTRRGCNVVTTAGEDGNVLFYRY